MRVVADCDVPPYPVMNAITAELRRAAAAHDVAELMSLWCGQGAPLGTELPAGELVRRRSSAGRGTSSSRLCALYRALLQPKNETASRIGRIKTAFARQRSLGVSGRSLQPSRRSSRSAVTGSPACFAITLRTSALIGNLWVPSPSAMNELRNG